MSDLAVAYRIYPGISKTPAYFPADKYKLSELCLRSFRSSLGGLRARIWVLLDGCPPEYETLFRRTLSGHDLEVVHLNKIGNTGTFAQQIDLLTRQSDAHYVYLAEDDYFYLPSALEKMVDFMANNPSVDFVTPYDHPDSYETSSRFERHLVRPWGDRYWRTASSTCLTFLSSRSTLEDTASMFRTYCQGNMDCSLWLSLTERSRLANPRIHFSSNFRFKIWARTWLWGWRQILFGQRYRLWAPLPTLATHMESTCLAPGADWQNLFAEAARNLR